MCQTHRLSVGLFLSVKKWLDTFCCKEERCEKEGVQMQIPLFTF